MAEPEPSPLDVLLRLMRFWLQDGKLKEAADVAKAAAPYVHRKPGGQDSGGEIATLRDDDLAALARSAEARASVAAQDQDEP